MYIYLTQARIHIRKTPMKRAENIKLYILINSV